MRVLVACEYSGVVRDAFLAAGHQAVSCDLQPTESPGPHLQCDVRKLLDQQWDLMIAHPPCQYLANSGLHWTKRGLRDPKLTDAALQLVWDLMHAPVNYIAIENPIGIISSRIRQYDQLVHPYQFGDNASKATCLWLKNLPKLVPTQYVEPRIVNGKKRWGNQRDDGQCKLGETKHRAKKRSRFYPGIAAAMASQWGLLL